jgi:hypothetical protein
MHLNIAEGLASKRKDDNRNIVDAAARDNSINCDRLESAVSKAYFNFKGELR